MSTIIIWKSTRLGILYPTINGRDVWRDLAKKHGCTLASPYYPLCNDRQEAEEWSSSRGYEFEFECQQADKLDIDPFD